jgi:NAD(P)-dependent dehydrogenase (short-subunit alcohol dehydrogenase family)
MTNLSGRVAVVTGAGRGTGRAVTLALARAGARVAVVDVNPDAAQTTADAITQNGGEALACPADVSNKMSAQTALYAALEAWGKVDVLVNAAHIAPERPALTLDEWEWDRVINVNLKGVFLASQTAARAMKETGGGFILNVIRRAPRSPHPAVRAAREGLLGLTAALAAEWAVFNVLVTTVESENATEAVIRLWDR